MPINEDGSTYPTQIYQLTRDDEIDAGEHGEGVANRQATELANRTAWLKNKVDELVTKVTALETAAANRGFAYLAHRKAAGNIGGNPASEKTWVVVPIDTEILDRGDNITLSGSTLTVKAGTYRVEGRVMMCGVIRGQSRLYDKTNASTLLVGDSIGSSKDVFATSTPEGGLTLSQHSIVSGEVTLTANTEIELQAIFTHLHQFSATWGVNVFGSGGTQVPTTEGTTEQYSSLILERIA